MEPDPKVVEALNRCGRTFIRAQEARDALAKGRPLASVKAIDAADQAHETALCDLRAALYASAPPVEEIPEEPRLFRVGVNY